MSENYFAGCLKGGLIYSRYDGKNLLVVITAALLLFIVLVAMPSKTTVHPI